MKRISPVVKLSFVLSVMSLVTAGSLSAAGETQRQTPNRGLASFWEKYINFPINDQVFLEPFVLEQFAIAGLIYPGTNSIDYGRVMCHGYAWMVAIKPPIDVLTPLAPLPPPYDIGSPDLHNYLDPEKMKKKRCDPADATHIIYYEGDDPIVGARHSAIISQFEYFPYSEGWVQSMNGVNVQLVLHKVDEYTAIHNQFKVAYYNMRRADGSLPWNLPPLTPSPNLVAHWCFDRVDSAGQYPDQAGLLPGQRVGPVPYPLPWWADGATCWGALPQTAEGFGPPSSGAFFFGQNFVQVPDNKNLDLGVGDFSIAFWLNAKTTSDVVLFDKRDPASLTGYHGLIYNGRMMFQIHGPKGYLNYYNASGRRINDGSCHLVVVTVDRDNPQGGRIYVDGLLDLTFNPRADFGALDNTAPLYFGRHTNPTNLRFTGILYNFRIWKRALSGDEVNTIFASDPQ